MKFSKRAGLWLGMVGMLASGVAQAIEVFPVVKEIREETPRENYVTVKSMFRAAENGDDKAADTEQYEFVTLELFHVPNPGDTTEKRIKELGSDDPTLVFSPTRLVIPYGEMRKVRIMPLKPVDRERVYRLRIRPSYPEQALDKGKVRFAIGYDVLLRYLPSGKQTQGIAIACKNNQWALTATGNVRSELRNLVVDGRKWKTPFNVYPEHSRTLSVNQRMSFELEGKLQVYEQCRLKG
ncbi:hypothetical protein COO59_10200 [Mixta theicola]|uniref:Fimbrial protein n=1 Tax=Mixta theicola TaxID=1458355 RepID=A0A2K1Q9Z5_9GAMM|nr:hypothetical protein [Mixta theicola]PNS11851.1 hypothetical protein COO59_10200 [Mixta theicola]GLR07779.1 hypothetical protein GCM10007905_04980 [Mixta theicola]